jgi:hypothetical protein
MNASKWVLFGTALAMMAATAGYLEKVRHTHRLGPPGVRVGPRAIYGEKGDVVATTSVQLPESVLGGKGESLPITQPELDTLPKDTTFGRRLYHFPDGFRAMINVVLMGTDRTSIHQPQFCLVGQNWIIDATERVRLHVDRPYPYDLPAMKLTASMRVLDDRKQPTMISGIYIYWFVTADKITSEQGVRMWSIAKTMVEKGELERWAYIAYFASCHPGQEEATYERLERFIRASVPDFQVVTGRESGRPQPVALQP